MLTQLPMPVSTKVILSFEIDRLINRVVIIEKQNIKVADTCRQLLLLSQLFNTNLHEVLNLIFSFHRTNRTMIDQHIKTLSELYVNKSFDVLITDLMENYPLVMNHMFDYDYYTKTGVVNFTSKDIFLTQFTHPEEIANHYDFIQSDFLIKTLLQNANELLAFVLNFINFSDYEKEIYQRINIFFYSLYLEMIPFLDQNSMVNFSVSPETKVDNFGTQLLIILDRL